MLSQSRRDLLQLLSMISFGSIAFALDAEPPPPGDDARAGPRLAGQLPSNGATSAPATFVLI